MSKIEINDIDRGIWFSIETLARSYEEDAVKVLVGVSNFNREKCLALAKETGINVNETMKIVDFEMNWDRSITLETRE